MTDVLRQYQAEVIAEFWRAVEAGQRRIIMVAPTASGKTVIARAIIEQARSNACGSLFLAHRREIITQTSKKLRGIPHGVIRPGDQPRPFELVQVASVQTLLRRAIKAGTMELPSPASSSSMNAITSSRRATDRSSSVIRIASSLASLLRHAVATAAASAASSRP